MKYDLGFFKKRPQRKAGLDIGSYNLKIVEIELKEGTWEIVSLGMRDIRKAKDISLAIKELGEEAGISIRQLNISLSGDNVATRYLSLPRMTEDELKKAIIFALEDHIPFRPEEVYTDYYILGEEPNSKNRIKVLLVAAKKDYLEEKINLVRQAGFEPKIVTIDAVALRNTFYFNHPTKDPLSIALLNIGDKATNLLITREKLPYFVRDTKFGGEAITALIQSKLGLSLKEAEELKYNLETASTEITQTIKAPLTTLLNEIFVSLDFYENLTERRVEEVYICGGSSQLIGLREFLSGYLNSKVFILEPLKNFSVSPHISKELLKKLSPFLAVAAGLALEEP